MRHFRTILAASYGNNADRVGTRAGTAGVGGGWGGVWTAALRYVNICIGLQ